MPRPKGCKCGVLKDGEVCPVHPDKLVEGAADSYRDARHREAEADSSAAPPPKSAKRKPDPPPRVPRPKRKPTPAGPTDEQLEDALRQVLKMLSVPMRMRCDYCADHMASTAAIAAANAIADSDIRDLVERAYVWANQYSGAGWLFIFAGVPLLHHAAPEFLYRPVAPLLGMPPRAARRTRSQPHTHTSTPRPTEAAGGEEPPAAAPAFDPAMAEAAAAMVAGMDLDQMLDYAKGLGIQVDVDQLNTLIAEDGRAPTTETPDDDFVDDQAVAATADVEATDAAAVAEAEVADAGADPDSSFAAA